MFCMGCGAELRRGTDRCAVCGRPLDDAAQNLRLVTAVAPSGAPPTAMSSSPMPSIARGDLDAPGLPRDATGRALLIVVLAMLVDLLAPWLDQEGIRWSPVDAGLPALLIVVVLAVALTPLAHPTLRHDPLAAVAPLIVGAAAFGATVFLWVTLFFETSRPSALPILGQSFPVNNRVGFAILYPSVDLGLFLFMLGSCVLGYIGYQMFLAAARAAARAPLPTAHPSEVLSAAPPSSALAQGTVTEQAPRHIPLAPVTAPNPSTATIATTLNALPAESGESIGSQIHGASAIHTSTHASPIASPGTAEWNTAPTPPDRLRPPSLGPWRRQSGVRR